MVCGSAPGNCAVTWIVGESTSGSAATGSSSYPMMPNRTIAAIRRAVAIGLCMKAAERFMAACPSFSCEGFGTAPGLFGSASVTSVPGESRYWPRSTTVSPALNPFSTSASAPNVWRTETGRIGRLVVLADDKDERSLRPLLDRIERNR